MKMKMSNKLRRNLMVGSIFAVLALSASVRVFGQTSDDSSDASDDSSSQSASDQSDQTPHKSKPWISPATQKFLLRLPQMLTASKDILHNINTKNFNLDSYWGDLGKLGLINPADQSTKVWSETIKSIGHSPYSNPKTPQGVYDLQRHTTVVSSENTQQLSQAVFGTQGQQALSQTNQDIQDSQKADQSAHDGVDDTYEVAADQAQQDATQATNVADKAQQAQNETVSQDILKEIAAQNAGLAEIGAGNSAQIANMGRIASYQSIQSSSTNAQLTALNERGQLLEVLAASQNYQQAQTNAALQNQTYYQQAKDNLNQDAAYQTASKIFIPGLMPKEPG